MRKPPLISYIVYYHYETYRIINLQQAKNVVQHSNTSAVQAVMKLKAN